MMHQRVCRAPTHHRSATAPNDDWPGPEVMAVHDAGAGEHERCQIYQRHHHDVDEQHHPLEI